MLQTFEVLSFGRKTAIRLGTKKPALQDGRRVCILKMISRLHNIHCLYKRRSLERKDKGKPFPMANNSSDQPGSGSQKKQPPETTIFFGLFHALEFWQK